MALFSIKGVYEYFWNVFFGESTEVVRAARVADVIMTDIDSKTKEHRAQAKVFAPLCMLDEALRAFVGINYRLEYQPLDDRSIGAGPDFVVHAYDVVTGELFFKVNAYGVYLMDEGEYVYKYTSLRFRMPYGKTSEFIHLK